MFGSAIRKNRSALLGVSLREAVAVAVSIGVAVPVGIAIAITITITVSVTVAVPGPGDGDYGCRANAGRDVGAAAAAVRTGLTKPVSAARRRCGFAGGPHRILVGSTSRRAGR